LVIKPWHNLLKKVNLLGQDLAPLNCFMSVFL
jgi:hypothetical protein